MNSKVNNTLHNKDLYLRELTRIYEQQTELNRRIEKLAAAIRNDRPPSDTPPPIDIHRMVESIVMGHRV